MTVAAIDVGSNSVRVLVADPDLGPRARLMTITRLGQGVDAAGLLDDDALARTLAVIEVYAAKARALGAQRLRITATSAVRDAADADRFFAGVRAATGVDAEVLTGEQEAALTFRGATSAVDCPAPHLVLDIGGGSTELIRGTAAVEASTSRQLGCVRLTERALHTDPPPTTEIAAAREIISAELDAAEALVDPAAAASCIGVAGTVTTLAALHRDLPAYQPEAVHGTRVPAAAVGVLVHRLAAMTSAERAGLGPIDPGREDVILAGALILQAVLDRFGFPAVTASEADLLDGLVFDLLACG